VPRGEYGGAITYVAEHVSDERRGFYTAGCRPRDSRNRRVARVIIITQTYFGAEAFNAWAWRVRSWCPSAVGMAIYIRLQLGRGRFRRDQGKGALTKEPWKEAFLGRTSSNLIATVVLIGQGGLVSGSSRPVIPADDRADGSADRSLIVGAALLIASRA